jgi:hypothetical protein
VKTSWGFSSMMKTISAGIMFGASFPFSGNVIFVPFFQPGFTSIVRISSTCETLLKR